jgi:hypothetical protein
MVRIDCAFNEGYRTLGFGRKKVPGKPLVYAKPHHPFQSAHLDLIPIFTGEGVDSLLLETLLTL